MAGEAKRGKLTKLDEIKARLAAATPGPWVAGPRHAHNDGTQDEMDGLGWDIDGPPEPMDGQFSRCADAKIIAHMREDMAKLVAVVDALIAVRSNHGLKRAIRQLRFVAMTQPASHYRATCDTLADKLEALL